MSVICRRDGQSYSLVKGAPEAVLVRCVSSMREGELVSLAKAERQAWLSRVAGLAGAGLRVLAIAERRLPEGARTQAEAEQDLIFLGLVRFVDPSRSEAREVMLACQAAGLFAAVSLVYLLTWYSGAGFEQHAAHQTGLLLMRDESSDASETGLKEGRNRASRRMSGDPDEDILALSFVRRQENQRLS